MCHSNMLLDMNDERHSEGGLLLCLLLIFRVTKLDFFDLSQEDFSVSVVVPIPILQVFAIGHHSDRFAS